MSDGLFQPNHRGFELRFDSIQALARQIGDKGNGLSQCLEQFKSMYMDMTRPGSNHNHRNARRVLGLKLKSCMVEAVKIYLGDRLLWEVVNDLGQLESEGILDPTPEQSKAWDEARGIGRDYPTEGINPTPDMIAEWWKKDLESQLWNKLIEPEDRQSLLDEGVLDSDTALRAWLFGLAESIYPRP